MAVQVQAYILIQTEVGKAAQVAQEVHGIAGVTAADDVTGPYDVIVEVETASLRELGADILSRLDTVPGIARTITCPIISH